MKVYEVVSQKNNILSERNHPRTVADGIELVADKQIMPNGTIRVLIPNGEILEFANQEDLNRQINTAKRDMASKLTRFGSLRNLALSNFTWWPAAALQIFEAVETAIYEFSTPESANTEAVMEEVLEAASIVIVTGLTGTVRRIARSGQAIGWLRRLTTAKRAAQMSTAALGAAGFATGGTTWIGALITGAGWIAAEVALYFATEYFVDMLMDEFFDPEELNQEIRTELADEMALLFGLTRDARQVDTDGDGDPDNIDPETGRTTDPETGQEYKYDLGDLTDQDVERLLRGDPERVDQLAQDPRYADFFRRYRTVRNLDVAEPQESISEQSQGRVPDENDLRNFVDYLDEKGYDNSLKRNVIRVARQKLEQG